MTTYTFTLPNNTEIVVLAKRFSEAYKSLGKLLKVEYPTYLSIMIEK